MTDRARGSWFAALLALIGGATIVVGSLLPWLDVSGGVSVGSVSISGTPKGSRLPPGRVALAAGVVVVILGLLLLALRTPRKVVGLLVIVGGVVAVATVLFVGSSVRARYFDFAIEKGAPADKADEVRTSLANLFDVSGQEVRLGAGLYVVIGGGALAVVGGTTALFSRRKRLPTEEAFEPEGWLAARAEEPVAGRADTSEDLGTREPADRPGVPVVVEATKTNHPAMSVEPAGADAPDEPQTSSPADELAAWTKPFPDTWAAKAPSKRRPRRRS
jgi:hypothetical protein